MTPEGTTGPLDLPWWDAKKHQALAEIATAMQAPGTIGPNIWGAIKDLAQAVVGPPMEDTGDPAQNSRNLMQGLAGFGVGSIAKLGLRQGPLSPTGAHFAERGSSAWFAPEDPALGRYNLGGVNILNTANPKQVLPVLRSLAQHPDIKALKSEFAAGVPTKGTQFDYGGDTMTVSPAEIRASLAQQLLAARRGEAPDVSYFHAETTPLAEVAGKHGYGGYKVWENDDAIAPSTNFIWDLAKVRPHGEIAKREMQALREVIKWNEAVARGYTVLEP